MEESGGFMSGLLDGFKKLFTPLSFVGKKEGETGGSGGMLDQLRGILDPNWGLKKVLGDQTGLPDLAAGLALLQQSNFSLRNGNKSFAVGSPGATSPADVLMRSMIAKMMNQQNAGEQQNTVSMPGPTERNSYVDTVIKNATEPIKLGPQGPSYNPNPNAIENNPFNSLMKPGQPFVR